MKTVFWKSKLRCDEPEQGTIFWKHVVHIRLKVLRTALPSHLPRMQHYTRSHGLLLHRKKVGNLTFPTYDEEKCTRIPLRTPFLFLFFNKQSLLNKT